LAHWDPERQGKTFSFEDGKAVQAAIRENAWKKRAQLVAAYRCPRKHDGLRRWERSEKEVETKAAGAADMPALKE
jgi:hypothetical protein